jgi:predicted ribosomally synthesized peptide with nif11-like leader
MSKESVSEFFLAVSSDETLQEKLAAATQPENFIKIAQEKGYSFTTEELFAVISEQNNGELNDQELNTVAAAGPCFGGGHSCRKPDFLEMLQNLGESGFQSSQLDIKGLRE